MSIYWYEKVNKLNEILLAWFFLFVEMRYTWVQIPPSVVTPTGAEVVERASLQIYIEFHCNAISNTTLKSDFSIPEFSVFCFRQNRKYQYIDVSWKINKSLLHLLCRHLWIPPAHT